MIQKSFRLSVRTALPDKRKKNVFYIIMFFFLDKKEPKNQDCQKKSDNSSAHYTKILKLTASWRFKQSEFWTFRSPELLLIFSQGRRLIVNTIFFPSNT
jgi:hypothetical protein